MGATGAMMAVQAVSSSVEADNQRRLGKYQQQMSRINSKRAEMQAEDALKRGEVEAARYGNKVNQMVGSQKAALAAQGIDVASGSAADIIDQTYAFGVEDVQTIRNNAFREALGYRQQASDYIGQGNLARSGAKAQANQTLIAGGMKSLSYGISAYGDYKKANTTQTSSSPKSTADTRSGSRRVADFERGGL